MSEGKSTRHLRSGPTTIASLPPEVLTRVLNFIARPIPEPNSNAEWHAAQQGDLATCMRVNVDFNIAAAPQLYNRVVTTEPARMMYGYYRPAAHRGIQSKAALIGTITHLSVDYADPHREPSYEDILRPTKGSFKLITQVGIARFPSSQGTGHDLDNPGNLILRNLDECYTDLMRFISLLLLDPDTDGSGGPVFSTLETLALLPTSGGMHGEWEFFRDYTHDDMGKIIEIISGALVRNKDGPPYSFPVLKHMCCRATPGPLTLGQTFGRSEPPRPGDYSFTPLLRCHFYGGPDMISHHIGDPTEYVLETPFGFRPYTADGAGNACTTFANFLNQLAGFVGSGWRSHLRRKPVMLDVYASSQFGPNGAMLRPGKEDQYVENINALLAEYTLPDARAMYKVKVHKLGKESACQACGTGPTVPRPPPSATNPVLPIRSKWAQPSTPRYVLSSA